MKLNIITIVILGFSMLFVTGQAYAPCIEGPGINCNNYPPPSLDQIKSDKLNYETSDKPIVTIIGAPDAVAHLEIDDSSSNIIFTHDINMAPNGTVKYVLDISSYKPGVYSVIATSLISKLTTSFSVGLAPTGGSIGLNSDRNSYLPGDNVIIVGTWMSNTLIQLSLIDPSGISIKSIQTFSDKTGHFSSFNFTIPLNAIPGIWQIGATSGVSHSQVQITINSTLDNISNIKMDKVAILSPLKQLESGISADDVKCNQGFQLIFKQENMSPMCVTPDTSKILIERGWASTIAGISFGNQYTSKIPDLPVLFMPCDTPYPQSNTGVAVLYMPTNSIGKICVKYSNPNDTPVPIVGGIRIFDPNNSYLNATGVTTWIGSTNDMIPKGDSTAVYWVKTGNQTGFYGLRFVCGATPFAVGYDNNSKIVSSNFPFVRVTHSCPVMLYDVKIEDLSGIGVKYIPFP